jgi:hypothetical protein
MMGSCHHSGWREWGKEVAGAEIEKGSDLWEKDIL